MRRARRPDNLPNAVRVAAIIVVASAFWLAGCAAPSTPTQPAEMTESTTAPATVTTVSPPPPPADQSGAQPASSQAPDSGTDPISTPTSTSGRPTVDSTPPGTITVHGTIIEGIRPTCRVINTGSRHYALTGPGTGDLHEGDMVTVTGLPRPDLINPCGVTFLVTHIEEPTS